MRGLSVQGQARRAQVAKIDGMQRAAVPTATTRAARALRACLPWCALAWAGTAGAAAPRVQAPAVPPHLVASQPAQRYPAPVVRHLVTQDRAVRIQEEQVRGATTSIQVKPLHGGARYSIVPPQTTQPGPGSMQGRMQWRIGTFQ